jgi:hypothetical protein
MFFFECNEAKSSALSIVYIFENYCIDHFSKLVEVLSQFLIGEFEIKSANKYFLSGIRKLHILFINR